MIQDVVKKNLCTQCGACAGICPVAAISLVRNKEGELFPSVSDKCIKCGNCLKVCPGHEVDFKSLNIAIFREEAVNMHLGSYKKCYLAQSSDKKVFQASTSGGVVTQICLNLLKQKKITGVVMVRAGKDPLYPEVFIARNVRDIFSCTKSKYVSVPIGQIIGKLRELPGRFALVGLPCQMHGIRKAEELDPKLKNKIAYHIGLFCAYVPERSYLHWFAKESGVDLQTVKSIGFRSGWPGKLVFHTEKDIEFPKEDYYYFPLTLPFINKRCLKCTDQVNELADISVGDAWHISDRKQAVIIDRKGLLTGTLSGNLELKEIEADEIIKTQKQQLWMKKEGYRSRIIMNPPRYNQSFPESKFRDFTKNFLIYALIGMRRIGLWQRLPKAILRRYAEKISRK